MLTEEAEIKEQLANLRRGLRAGYDSFKIPRWFAEYVVEKLENK